MSTFTKQVLVDSTSKYVVKFTGEITGSAGPGSDTTNTTIDVSTLLGAMDNTSANLLSAASHGGEFNTYKTTIQAVDFCVASANAGGYLLINWRGNTGNGMSNTLAFTLAGSGEFLAAPDSYVIPFNGASNGANSGDVALESNGISAGSYTVIITLRKDNNQFTYGKLLDPSSYAN